MYDLYFDRNKTDTIINNTLNYIYDYLITINGTMISNNNILLESENKIAILWGLESKYKPDTKFRTEIKNKYKYVIVIEQGFINRDVYRSFTINEQGGLSYPKSNNSDGQRLLQLNLDTKSIRFNKNGYILILGQIPWDRQLTFLDTTYNEWLNNIIVEIKKKQIEK